MSQTRNYMPLFIRFWKRVDVRGEQDCWEWTGTRKTFYGIMSVGNGDRTEIAVHRVSWMLHFGPPPADAYVRQRCGNRFCVNPKHLYLMTQAEVDAEIAASIRVEKSICAKVGHCNFCNRNIDAGGTIAFNEVVYQLSGTGMLARLCHRCMASLIAQVRA